MSKRQNNLFYVHPNFFFFPPPPPPPPTSTNPHLHLQPPLSGVLRTQKLRTRLVGAKHFQTRSLRCREWGSLSTAIFNWQWHWAKCLLFFVFYICLSGCRFVKFADCFVLSTLKSVLNSLCVLISFLDWACWNSRNNHTCLTDIVKIWQNSGIHSHWCWRWRSCCCFLFVSLLNV